MRRPRAVILVAVLDGGLASACHRSLDSSDAQTASKDADANLDVAGESSGDHPSACYPLFHACTMTDECCAPNRCLNITGTPACQQEGPAGDADSPEVADAAQSDGGEDAVACYPLFHSCTSSEQCCAPNLCITINGGPACQVEGPARTQFSSWTSCGWTSSGSCLCDGIRACEAVAGGSFSAFGSQQARVCAIEPDVCEYIVFVETEGGGTARRCRVPRNSGSCVAGFGNTTDSHCVGLFTCNLLMGTCPPDVTPGGPVISCR